MTGFKHAHVYSSFYLWTKVPCSVCHQIYSLEQCPRGKSRVILEVKEVKQSTKKKKKLKTNSHTRKNRAKKMMLHFPDQKVEWSQVITVQKLRDILSLFSFFLGQQKDTLLDRRKIGNEIKYFVPSCCLFVPLQGPQMDKLSPEAIKLAQTLYN